MRARRLGALLLGLSAGCYRYVQIPVAAAPPHEEVRVRVTDAAAARLVKELGVYTTELEGTVGRGSADSLSVSVAIGRDYRGMTLDSARQTLFVLPSEVIEVRRREFSRGKTALVSAGALAAFAIVIGSVAQLGDPNSNDGDLPPPPPPLLAPRFGLRLRLPIH